MSQTMSQTESPTDLALVADFAPPSREAWLTLVAKVLKGADFDKRLVSRPVEGLTVQPLYTRADALPGTAAVGRYGWYPGGWDVRQRHLEPNPEAANKAILEDLAGGGISVLLQIQAPGQAGLNYGAAALETALRGVDLKGVAVALDARENTMDAAGSLLELWRTAGLNENERRGGFNYDPLGVLAKTGTLYYPAARSAEIAAKLAADCRTMSHVTALLADGRPYHEAGASEAQEIGAMLATLVAYLRACEAAGLRPRAALGKIALGVGGRCRLVPHDGQVPRRPPPARPRGGRLRCRQRGGVGSPQRLHLRADDGPARPVGEPAPHHRRLRRCRVQRRRGHHGAALHLGARQARCLRPPHCP